MKKLLWTTLSLFALSCFAIAGDCKKCKKDGEEEKKEGTLAGKCKKECDKEGEAEEGTLA